MENIIGTQRKIPKGTIFWSVGLQENVRAERDITIEITNTCSGNTFIFGNKIDNGFLSGLDRNINFEIMVDYNKTEDYLIPIPMPIYVEPVYGNTKLLSDNAIQSNVGQNLSYDAKFLQDRLNVVTNYDKPKVIDYFSLMNKLYGHKPINEMTKLEKIVAKIDLNSRFPVAIPNSFVLVDQKVAEEIANSNDGEIFDEIFMKVMKACQIPSHVVESMIEEQNFYKQQGIDSMTIPEKILKHKKIFK